MKVQKLIGWLQDIPVEYELIIMKEDEELIILGDLQIYNNTREVTLEVG